MSIKLMQRQRGLSLVELVIFIVVMGIAAVVLLRVMGMFTSNTADPVRRKQALLLAESYLEEVELARFTYCDPVDPKAAAATSTADCSANGAEGLGQESISSQGRPYDNVSDYATAANVAQQNFTDGSGHLTDINGNLIDSTGQLAGYTVTVTLNVVPAVSPLGPSGAMAITSDTTPAGMNALRITVQVSYGSGANAGTVTLDGYRTRYAPRAVP